jgi:hypothetical protein
MSDQNKTQEAGQLGSLSGVGGSAPSLEKEVKRLKTMVAKGKGRASALTFISSLERSELHRARRTIYKLYVENKRLGGTLWKKIEASYRRAENEMEELRREMEEPLPNNKAEERDE